MRKLVPVALFMAFAVAFCSCNKKYTCTCVKVKGKSTQDTIRYAINDRMKQKYAEAVCHDKETALAAHVYSCKLD